MLKSWGNNESILAASGAALGFNRTWFLVPRPVYVRLTAPLVTPEECDRIDGSVVEALAAMRLQALHL
jgi:hypothetical protein